MVKPDGRSPSGKRDRAILATLLCHALCRAELCKRPRYATDKQGEASLATAAPSSMTLSGSPDGFPQKKLLQRRLLRLA